MANWFGGFVAGDAAHARLYNGVKFLVPDEIPIDVANDRTIGLGSEDVVCVAAPSQVVVCMYLGAV